MTPKGRVLAALAHLEPDRVPHGEFATDHSVIEQALGRPTYWRGKRRLTEALWAGKRDEVVEGMKRDIVDFTLKLGIDMVPVNAMPHRDCPILAPKQIDKDTWEDANGNILKYSPETEDIGLHHESGKGIPRPDFRLPPEPDASEMELTKHVIEELGQTHFIFARPGRNMGAGGYIKGWSADRFIRVAEDPEGVARQEMASAEGMVNIVRPFAEAGVDAVSIGSDYGFNSGPFVSPDTFRKVYFPAMKRRCEIIHDFGLPVLFHSCGNNRVILDQMVEAGMDAYQAIQPIERIEEIKELHGDRLTLWGGVSTDTLGRGTPEEVRQQALFSIKHCAPDGGLILSSSHSVVVRTPLANYQAMLDTIRERGTYPIDIPEAVPTPGWGGA
jgi:uroporphyrinogen decarboxylase